MSEHAIDRLLTTVSFFLNAKHDASLDFLFLMQMLSDKDADAKCPYDAYVSF